MAFPAFFHIALIFFPRCRFINPQKMGEVLAIWKTYGKMGVSKLAWIVHLDCLREKDGKIYEWTADEQVLPLAKDLRNYFDSKAYEEKVKITQKRLSYSIDWECYRRKIRKEESGLN